MSNDNVEKLNGIIPEAWFDLIGRVVPGTVIVLASFRTDPVSKLPNLSLGGFAVGLVVAYVVGFVFDVVSDGLFGWVFTEPATRWRVFRWVPRPKDCYSNRELWEEIDKQRPPRREIAGKISA